MMEDTLEYLQRAIEHAPQDPGRLAPDLIGWKTPAGLCLCARCAGRIMARGYQLPRNATPLWDKAEITCVLCPAPVKYAVYRCMDGDGAGNVDFLDEIIAVTLDEAETTAHLMYGADCDEWHLDIQPV